MIYKFCGEIFENGKRLFISIPFNVWEECGQKGNIPVKVTVDDFTYECKLVPKGNGMYYIPVNKSYCNKISLNNQLEISFEIISGLSRINSNSLYSLEKPVRKIDGIDIIIAPKAGLCGQASVAMLSGLSIDEIITLMGSQGSMSKVIEALDYYGIAHSDKMIYNFKELPKCCIINSKGHLLVFYNGKYYDPYKAIMEEFDINKITGFLEILI